MIEDEVMKEIHKNQKRLRQKRLSWDKEVKYMNEKVRDLDKQHNYRVAAPIHTQSLNTV